MCVLYVQVLFVYFLFFIIIHGHIFRHLGLSGQSIGHLDYFATSEMIHCSKGHRSYRRKKWCVFLFAGTLLSADVVNLPGNAKLGAAPQYKYKYRHLQYTLYLYAQHQYIVILHNEM